MQRTCTEFVFRSKETRVCGTQSNIHHSRWVRRLTSTVWVCLDSVEMKVTLLPLRFILHESPTGWSSALRIRTTTMPAAGRARRESLGGGSTTAQDRCWIVTPTPSGMQTLMYMYGMLFLHACWWSSINVDLKQRCCYLWDTGHELEVCSGNKGQGWRMGVVNLAVLVYWGRRLKGHELFEEIKVHLPWENPGYAYGAKSICIPNFDNISIRGWVITTVLPVSENGRPPYWNSTSNLPYSSPSA